MTTFRLATINVHSFRTPKISGSNIDDLISILNTLHLDLIAVQETKNNEKWKEFCQRLSLPYFIYGSCDQDYLGNGFASRYPFQYHSNQQASSSCKDGKRALLQCRLDGDHSFIKDRSFAVTHLNHFNEDNRLEQIKEFNLDKLNIDILMGDMNALTREDYSEKYYHKEVLHVRENSRWETPRFDLTKLITNEWNYQDAFRFKNPQMQDKQVATCRFGTRIDYIYVRPRIDDDWILNECSIIDTKGATDHNAVFAEFIKISK